MECQWVRRLLHAARAFLGEPLGMGREPAAGLVKLAARRPARDSECL